MTLPVRPPAELEPIVSAIGADATLLLIEAHGGVRIAVPRRARKNSSLSGVIGYDALIGLVEAFGGLWLKVPLAKGWRVAIMRERDGASLADIARKLQMSESAVTRHVAAAARMKGRHERSGPNAAQPRLPGLG